MKIKTKEINSLLISVYSFIFLLCLSLNCPADNKAAVIQKIAGYIVEYNTEQIRLSDSNDNYRGEEGILFINPEAGLKLGLKVYADKDYDEAGILFEKATEALSDAEQALSYRGKRDAEQDIIKKIISNILDHKESLLLANEKLIAYRKNINKEQDDRFNKDICNKIILTYLEEALKETNNNLRDALAFFYNKCHDARNSKHFLTSENIRFVNYVYSRFIAQTSQDEIKLFDTDSNTRNGNGSDFGEWKKVVNEEQPEYLPFIESALEKHGSTIYRTDPLLFLALMKKESSFRPKAVSLVGAAGLTQLMPQTALDLGLKNIYMPDYFKKAGELFRTERNMRTKAREMLLSISKKDDTMAAKQAREHMLKSLKEGEKRKELLKRYKKELADGKNDDRFDPQKVIEAGYIYFTRLMKSYNGDISLALASYNAGQHRVKEFDGLPPFRETLSFRNTILQYYRGYLEMLTN